MSNTSFPIPQIDYSSRDFQSIITELIGNINKYLEEWTDHNPSDPGIVLLELFSGVADMLHFYVDRAANESFLPTLLKRESAIKVLKLIDYELRSAVPATVDLTFTLGSVESEDVLIPEGTICQAGTDNSPVYFETTEDLTIEAGELSGTVGAIEGLTKEEEIGTSNGDFFQQFKLDGNPIIDGSLEIYIDEGAGYIKWEEEDTLVLSDGDEEVYNTQRDADDYVTIFFGDNGQGKVPAPGGLLKAVYRLGGGLYGNRIGIGEINSIVSTIMHEGQPLTLSVENELAPSGGEDRQSIENAKIFGPRTLRTLWRAVSPNDYKTLTEDYPGVAKVLFSPQEPLILRIFYIYVAPVGGGLPSSTLKESLLEYLDEINMTNDVIEIKDPTYVKIDIEGTVYLFPNYVQADVVEDVTETYEEYMNFDTSEAIQFGESPRISDVYRLIDERPGVDYVILTKFTRRPVPVWISKSGDAIFDEDWSIGEYAVDEYWTVVFTSATEFTVTGTTSGLQSNTGVIGGLYYSDNMSIGFIIANSGDAMEAGNTARFRTSKKLDHVAMDDNEIPEMGTNGLQYSGGAT